MWQLAQRAPWVSAACFTVARSIFAFSPLWQARQVSAVSPASPLRPTALCGLWQFVQASTAGLWRTGRAMMAWNSSWQPAQSSLIFPRMGPGAARSFRSWQTEQSPSS